MQTTFELLQEISLQFKDAIHTNKTIDESYIHALENHCQNNPEESAGTAYLLSIHHFWIAIQNPALSETHIQHAKKWLDQACKLHLTLTNAALKPFSMHADFLQKNLYDGSFAIPIWLEGEILFAFNLHQNTITLEKSAFKEDFLKMASGSEKGNNSILTLYYYSKAYEQTDDLQKKATATNNAEELAKNLSKLKPASLIRRIHNLKDNTSDEDSAAFLNDLLNHKTLPGKIFLSCYPIDKDLVYGIILHIPDTRAQTECLIRVLGWDTTKTVYENQSDPLYSIVRSKRMKSSFFSDSTLEKLENMLIRLDNSFNGCQGKLFLQESLKTEKCEGIDFMWI